MKWLVILLASTNIGFSQNLKKHQWQERIILITADLSNSELLAQQLAGFQKQNEALIDRQMVVYSCVANNCEFYDGKVSSKVDSGNNDYNGFKVRLMGLDGQIKYESNQVESPKVYFSLIDRMPMRRSEMRKRIKDKGYE